MYHIRRANTRDLDKLLQFFDERKIEFIPHPWIKRQLLGDPRNKPMTVMIVLFGESIVAAAIMTNKKTLWRIHVNEGHRDKGLGKKLVHTLCPHRVKASRASLGYWKKLGIPALIGGSRG